jgi:hypothetical protein
MLPPDPILRKSVIPPGPGPKFGRNRPVSVGPHFKMRNYLRASLPPPPTSCDFSAPASAILSDIMQNDQLGDCVVAALYHYLGVLTGNAGSPFHATPTQIVSDYSAIGGYVPGDPSTDQGCDEITALNYAVSHGLANGTKASGWLSVDASNISEVKSTIFLFEGALLTLELPDPYVNPFPSGNGFVWDVGAPDPNQGHAIMACGFDTKGPMIDTWGMLGTMTWAALAALCTLNAGGGLYVLLTPDILAKGASKAPNGFAWADLIADFDTMGGQLPLPVPDPVVVPPTPPGMTVTLAQAQAWVQAGLASGHPLMTRTTAETLAKGALAASWPSS